MIVTVTKKHIEKAIKDLSNGENSRSQYCPVAQALKESNPLTYISVNAVGCYLVKGSASHYRHSDNLKKQIRLFDTTGKFKPGRYATRLAK